MYLSSPPNLVKALASQMTWTGPVSDAAGAPLVYLTFDDGPHPEITREVLGILEEHKATATFFCVGNNVVSFPEVVQEAKAKGHRIGNHTFQHLSGWKASNWAYYRDFLKAQSWMPDVQQFRPPYGRITRSQADAIGARAEVVMWDVLARDWEPKLSAMECMSILKRNTSAGSIVVFHDSVKAAPRMLKALPAYLGWLNNEGYRVAPLPIRLRNTAAE